MEIVIPQLTFMSLFGLIILYGLLWSVLGYLIGRRSGVHDGFVRGQKQGFYDAVDHMKK
jgi:hypothetical protein